MVNLQKFSLILASAVFSGCVFASATMTITDTEISARVKYMFQQNQNFSAAGIKSTVNHGIVSLKGSVDSAEEAASLIQSIEAIAGVKDINTNNLMLKTTNQAISETDDMYISAKIKGIYTKEKVFGKKDFNSLGIMVETNEGIVTLNGPVMNVKAAQWEKQVARAVKLAEKVKGVKAVEPKFGAADSDSVVTEPTSAAIAPASGAMSE